MNSLATDLATGCEQLLATAENKPRNPLSRNPIDYVYIGRRPRQARPVDIGQFGIEDQQTHIHPTI